MSEISCVCDQTPRQGNPQPVALISRNSRRFGQEKKKTGSEGSREARALDYEVSLVPVWRNSLTPARPSSIPCQCSHLRSAGGTAALCRAELDCVTAQTSSPSIKA